MSQCLKLLVFIVATFASLSSAVDYKVLSTAPSAGVVQQDFGYGFKVAHQHTDDLNNKLLLEPTEIFPQYDFQVSIERGNDVVCSGAIVYGGQHVVTAASCNVQTTDIVRIKAPQLKRNYGEVLGITCVKNLHNYRLRSGRLDSDIAVVRLNETTAQISLFPNGPDYMPNKGQVTSYSALAGHPHKYSLIVTDVPIISAAACEKLGFRVTDSMLCAGEYAPKTPFCSEDRGSPLFSEGKLIGVKTRGERCSRNVLPGVYTNVAVFQQWILDTIRNSNCKIV